MFTREIWGDIEDFPDHAISNLGNVANLKTDTILKGSVNAQGITTITLRRDRRAYTRSVAVLVAKAFLEPYPNFLFTTPIHRDGDKRNCTADNLMWRPRWFAVKFHKQFFEESFQFNTLHVVDLESNQEYHTIKEPCIEFGILFTDIMRSITSLNHVFPTGQHFRYANSNI